MTTTYPVTVVIPTIPQRRDFLVSRCIPSVYTSGPEQVFIIGDRGLNANEKRNVGGDASTQPYLLFVDDDSEVSSDILRQMVEALEKDRGAAFAYSNYRMIRGSDAQHAAPGKWNPDRLYHSNYIDTTSLIRRCNFPGFDPKIRRFQDWDLWLTIVARGGWGVYVPSTLFEKHTIDQGISFTVPMDEAMKAIKEKHRL